MRFRSLPVAIALAANFPAGAQTPPWNPAGPENRQLLPTFNYATVESVLTAIGARFARRGTADRLSLSPGGGGKVS